ncbi:hypothetical protein UFOVP1492_10 [uncultured Caudovirales phage]|uniref:Uncharacterized protein n=1 Tax=uncultured Caudovirales phage TaxID=2100421 RepID=A0A6J5RC82_9CAUD|nr:hypothetical protein UFOVP1127_124 [uncultured Caudovirales phage]CAB4193472.1 hypothetical protein UFOVP1242_86 [uncultured Caudovirales phage]CAB4217109.1 hypothetical protein UFOVP1492_10 [uncultured Caudovirales phage]CAB5231225.1 hypothetical protein UFOVP1580_39 [uncultured Caudovirales phage]
MNLLTHYGPIEGFPADPFLRMQRVLQIAYGHGNFSLTIDADWLDTVDRLDEPHVLASIEDEYKRALEYWQKILPDHQFVGHKFGREDQPFGVWNNEDRLLSMRGAAAFAKSVMTSQGLLDLSEKMAVERLEAVLNPEQALRAFGYPSVAISPLSGRSALILYVSRGAYFKFCSTTTDYYVSAGYREEAVDAIILAVGEDFEKAPLTVDDAGKLCLYGPMLFGETNTRLDQALDLLQQVSAWWNAWHEADNPSEVADPPMEHIYSLLKGYMK